MTTTFAQEGARVETLEDVGMKRCEVDELLDNNRIDRAQSDALHRVLNNMETLLRMESSYRAMKARGGRNETLDRFFSDADSD